jgi:hypothetical protein
MRAPEERNPSAANAGVAEKIKAQGSTIDASEINWKPVDLQAKRLQARFHISWPLAVVTAEHIYGRAPA